MVGRGAGEKGGRWGWGKEGGGVGVARRGGKLGRGVSGPKKRPHAYPCGGSPSLILCRGWVQNTRVPWEE